MKTEFTTVYIDNGYGDLAGLDVHYTHYKGCKGGFRDGLQIEPDDPPSLEIEQVSIQNASGEEVTLTDLLNDEAMVAIKEKVWSEIT